MSVLGLLVDVMEDMGYDPRNSIDCSRFVSEILKSTIGDSTSMPINPNSAFVRVFFDLPTPVAVELDAAVKASGKSKRQYISDVISQHVASTKTPTKGKGK